MLSISKILVSCCIHICWYTLIISRRVTLPPYRQKSTPSVCFWALCNNTVKHRLIFEKSIWARLIITDFIIDEVFMIVKLETVVMTPRTEWKCKNTCHGVQLLVVYCIYHVNSLNNFEVSARFKLLCPCWPFYCEYLLLCRW